MRLVTRVLIVLAIVLSPAAALAQRINHAGRILGTTPVVTTPILFNTPEADAIMSSLQVMPTTNAFNEDVSRLPLLTNSTAMMMQIASDLTTTRRHLEPEFEMNFVLIADDQSPIAISMLNYPDESDDTNATTGRGMYPIPSVLPIETWPRGTGTTTNAVWQTMCDGDCHAIMLMPHGGRFWETWQTVRSTHTPAWEAANGARFDIGSNTLRPDGWTSGDAAGLPLLPALVRYDECQRGAIEHAVRLVVALSRAAHLYPATHQAGSRTGVNYPAMGQRIRLQSTYTAPASFTTCERAVVQALQTYGGIVADNGNFFSFSITPDQRYAANEFSHLSVIPITAFEVVQSTGATGGPRSPGAPTVDAGSDQTIALGAPLTLSGTATGTGITTTWYVYPYTTAPGTVTLGTPAALMTTAGFSAVGDYTLMLRARDGVHADAYDAVVVHVGTSSGTDAGITVDGGVDAGAAIDAATNVDAASGVDAATNADAASGVDAASGIDGGPLSDAGHSALTDSGHTSPDAQALDAGSVPPPAASCACGVSDQEHSTSGAMLVLALGALIAARRSRKR